MPISGITTDYSGRKKDISIAFRIDPSNINRQIVDLRFGKVSSFVAGIQKLIQRYMITFLTILGTQPNYPQYGTDILKILQQGNTISKNDLVHLFNFANLKVMTLFKAYQSSNPSEPSDEQISTAVLQDIQTGADFVYFDVKIFTLAGDEVNFLLPIPDQR
jgi:hypothetical protein